jgi:hypothetical protein
MTMTVPARLNNRTPSRPTIISPPYEVMAPFGLDDWEAVELDCVLEPEVDDADPDDDADEDEADEDGVVEETSVAFPTNPTPNARVDSPSKIQRSPPKI